MAHKKPNLPTRICAACGRPFAWRRKWAAVWNEVRYCSGACRTGRGPKPSAPTRREPGSRA